jgi:hypothetical protein
MVSLPPLTPVFNGAQTSEIYNLPEAWQHEPQCPLGVEYGAGEPSSVCCCQSQPIPLY